MIEWLNTAGGCLGGIDFPYSWWIPI